MEVEFCKYHGAGNDFLIADNRNGSLCLSSAQISHLCDRHSGFGADGVILLENSEVRDFRMVFFNPDGSGGMMCGNGGRCIVAFAADKGIVRTDRQVEFDAPDGPHTAVFIGRDDGFGTRIVRLKMKDVSGITFFPEENSCFLDTGTRHLVKFVKNLGDYPVQSEGKSLRNDARFAPQGTNVNFVEPEKTSEGTLLHIRTFEKGVEDETLACGTGIVASALAAYSQSLPGRIDPDGSVGFDIRTAIASLSVSFLPVGRGDGFRASEVWLTGPAAFVGIVKMDLRLSEV